MLVVVLSAVVAVFAYKFTVGDVKPSTDGRMEVQLSQDERNALLLEMRTWLQRAQGVLAAAAAMDFAAVVASTARASGMAAEAETPASLFRKIPVEMKRLGFDTRQKFDEIAADAEKAEGQPAHDHPVERRDEQLHRLSRDLSLFRHGKMNGGAGSTFASHSVEMTSRESRACPQGAPAAARGAVTAPRVRESAAMRRLIEETS